MDLAQLRKQIDELDSELLNLMLKRMDLVREVAAYKKDNEIPVFAPDREHEILDRLCAKVPEPHTAGIKLLYGIIMDLNKLNEYRMVPRDIKVPTQLGGASVRAIIPDVPSALCRYLSPLAAAEVFLSGIHSQALPGGKLVVDIELIGNQEDSNFSAALSVLSDTAERFTLL